MRAPCRTVNVADLAIQEVIDVGLTGSPSRAGDARGQAQPQPEGLQQATSTMSELWCVSGCDLAPLQQWCGPDSYDKHCSYQQGAGCS